ncbi:hypothetical protein [Streptomyces sp. RPT161]|uniref:hypothetical protein n=1 Tax=Streptomyces sp. RPT161 TaxID=3015993 RepID=UPI0022B8B669|nr:hypothetical protein [Streptomyces sp. RPT161]
MQRRKATVTATVAGLVLTGSLAAVAAPAYADGSSPSPSAGTAPHAHPKGPKTDGARALCRRVPKLDRRIAREIKRLDSGVGTPGSIAFLRQRVENAKKENHAAIAKFLGDRLSARQALLVNLKQRQSDLKDVATWCKANGKGKPANSTTSA